jgi:transaldolase
MYVVDLVAPNTVNTMPTKTMLAVADHGEIIGDTVTGGFDDARNMLDSLERLGIPYSDVVDVLEREGVDKFEKSWAELLSDVQDALAKAVQ